jgi:hypothetical protein
MNPPKPSYSMALPSASLPYPGKLLVSARYLTPVCFQWRQSTRMFHASMRPGPASRPKALMATFHTKPERNRLKDSSRSVWMAAFQPWQAHRHILCWLTPGPRNVPASGERLLALFPLPIDAPRSLSPCNAILLLVHFPCSAIHVIASLFPVRTWSSSKWLSFCRGTIVQAMVGAEWLAH